MFEGQMIPRQILNSVLPSSSSLSTYELYLSPGTPAHAMVRQAIFLITDSTAFTLVAMSSPGILYLILLGPSIL